MFGQRYKTTGVIYGLLAGFIAFSQPALADTQDPAVEYTPPPMFGESKSKAVEIPSETLRKETPDASDGPRDITRPSPVELLGYKDTAFSDITSTQLPFPEQKPANMPEIVASSLAAQKMPEVKKPDVDSDRIDEAGKLGKNSRGKIVNESGLAMMDEADRKLLVDQIIAAPSSVPTTKKVTSRNKIIEKPRRDTQKRSQNRGRRANPDALMPPRDILDDVSKRDEYPETRYSEPVKRLSPKRTSQERPSKDWASDFSEAEPSASGDSNLTLSYERGQIELTSGHKTSISKKLLSRLQDYPASRLEIKAYANRIDDMQSGARRISLARALAIREFLMESGISSDRMNLRALGNEEPDIASSDKKSGIDRVDIVVKSL